MCCVFEIRTYRNPHVVKSSRAGFYAACKLIKRVDHFKRITVQNYIFYSARIENENSAYCSMRAFFMYAVGFPHPVSAPCYV